jgi:hypothetical protein
MFKLWHGQSRTSEVLYRMRDAVVAPLSELWHGQSSPGQVLRGVRHASYGKTKARPEPSRRRKNISQFF